MGLEQASGKAPAATGVLLYPNKPHAGKRPRPLPERRRNHTYSDFAGLVQGFNPVLQIFLVIGLKKIPLGEGIDDCKRHG